MLQDDSHQSEQLGKLVVSYSNESGSSLGLEYSATSESDATAFFGVCASTLGSRAKLVSSSSSDDTKQTLSTGGDNMEKRIAVLETQVLHIQSDVSEIKSDQKIIISGISELKSDVKLLLQKHSDLSEKVSEKASKDNLDTKVGEIKTWILLILLLSIAMPAITFLLNLYLKK